ncbi:uncharacterized protein LOC131980705 isoform X1 [Centropristis striata]|uniref:uncharacterized protein LOC131980705 isoform X1 n=1 Tax=Centropristis striata TaxID=184440 RepID=UPI0027DF783F|nr:uncharacterized protein LOC131980705 isoform X1 [Centropristis striata]
MGNLQCPAEDAAHLASVARVFCPFPDYNPSPLFVNMVSINSSLHLRNHYRAVQSSLSPKQLEDFTQGLRTTFGREGKVTLGGVGVVALSLAVLFDTLARQVRGEWVSDSGPIPGLFLKNMRGYYPPQVHTVSEYLRLVPYIANNPSRMIEESERYLKQLIIDGHSLDKLGENKMFLMKDDITVVNDVLAQFFAHSLKFHLYRIKNITAGEFDLRERHPPTDMVFRLNCDPETVYKELLAGVQKSDNRTQEAFKTCNPGNGYEPKRFQVLLNRLIWENAIFIPAYAIGDASANIAKREDFDLQADALGKWK